MTRKTAIFLVFGLTMLGAGPARAFCIENSSPFTLRVHVETYNPYGRFAELFKPRGTGCCHWANQRCNPTGARDGLLMFSVRSKAKAKRTVYCGQGYMRRIFATADGTIRITESPGSLGGLKCDSRDFYNQPVTPLSIRKHKRRGLPPPIVVPPPPE